MNTRSTKIVMRRLTSDFFVQPTLDVATQLLGKYLVRKHGGTVLVGEINEVEAYIGEDDPACHAAKGRTSRTEILYGPPGKAYVYFIYGMYWCLNVVTQAEGFPSAVLIRSVVPRAGIEVMR